MSAVTADLPLTIKRMIPAPRERVFKAWTTPDELKQWHVGNVVACEMDLRVGGLIHILFAPR